MSAELKPIACPFCGGRDIFIEPDERGSGGQHVAPYHVGCAACKCEQCHDDQNEAIAAWNRRATPAPGAPADIRAMVLEEAAKVCDGLTHALDNAGVSYHRPATAERCARAIRELASAAPGAPGQEAAVSWQVRRTDGSPLACWETCTKDLYDLTLSTGRYCGFENGPPCEVRALGVIGAQEAAAGWNWQDMRSAPKNGTECLLETLECGLVVAYWDSFDVPPMWRNGFDDSKLTPVRWSVLPPRATMVQQEGQS